jgi:outer membrane protein
MRTCRLAFISLLTLAVSGATLAANEPESEPYSVALPQCFEEALARNPAIQQQRTEVERAAGTKLVFTSRALPRLSAQVRAGDREGSLYGAGGIFSILTAAFAQPLVDTGIPASLRRGKLEVLIAEQNLNLTVINELHALRQAYLRALLSRDLLDLHEQIEKRLEANHESQRELLDAGAGTRQAVMQAEIQVLNLKPSLAAYRQQYFDARTQLAERMGRAMSNPTGSAGALRLPLPTGDLDYAPVAFDAERESARALQRRSDLVLLRRVVEATGEEKRMIQAGYFPFITLTASTLFIPENVLLSKQTDVVAGRETRASEARAGATLSWRVVDNGRVTGASRRTESVREGYRIALRKLEANVPRELAGVAQALENADARLAGLNKAVAESEENLKLVETQVILGEATQLDFLNAQRNLLLVRAGVLQALYDHESARAELDRATGAYLEFAGHRQP